MAIQRSWCRQRLVLNRLLFAVIIGIGISSCQSSSSDKTATANLPLDAAAVRSLYNMKCGLCHGADGRMNYAGAKDLSISTLSKPEVITQITEGKGAMPPMKAQLTSEQIAAIADYVVTLRSH